MKLPRDDYHISAGFGTFTEKCPYKEDAEKLRLIRNQNEWDKLISLRVRLQKRIKECKYNEKEINMKENFREYAFNIRIGNELQQLLEGDGKCI